MMERLGIKLPENLDEFALFYHSKKAQQYILQMTITGDRSKDEFAYRFQEAYKKLVLRLSRPQLDEFEVVYRAEQNNIELFPGCMDMLNAWSNKSEKIGILTNGIPETQKKSTEILD